MKKMIMILGVLFLTACSFRSEMDPVQLHIPHSTTSSEAPTTSIIKEIETLYLNPSWPVFYKDENELEAAADLVIRGKVAYRVNNSFVENNISTYLTNTQVIILDVIKEDSSPVNDTIIVSQMGGTFGNLHVVSAATVLLTENQEVVLFLHKTSEGVYRPINEDDGVYVKAGDVFQNIATKSILRTDYYTIQ
ncbi:hypothetical protein [Paenibacillus terrigena]|uniref:hypothetical protein n=1 Tax=Paenibacillus terrigena TaxID=369333 RepID=UPI000374291E|nr:hypothetical protein [Paenibacillus terrigena]